MSPSGWSARGDSNPDLHGLNVPRLPIAPRADDGSGANGGIRTRTARLGRPAGNRYPTFALVRPTGIEPVPPRRQRGMHLHTQAEHGPVSPTGPSTVRQLSKTPLFRARHHVPFRTSRRRTELSRRLTRYFSAGQAKTKKAFQGIAPEGLVLDECRALKALCPPWGYQASCRSGS